MRESYLCRTANVSWKTCVLVKQMQSNSILKPTLGPPKKFQNPNHSRGGCNYKSHTLSWWPPKTCHHCRKTLNIDHMLLECAVLQQSSDEYYTANSLKTIFGTIPEIIIVESLPKAGFFCLHAGESKRPIVERTPNSWETERPIDNILIKVAQEAIRCPCLVLNN